MRVKILLILFLMLSFSGYAWLNLTTLSSAENEVVTTVMEEASQLEEPETLSLHALQKTNMFSILIVGLEILFIIYLIGATWYSGIR